MKKYEVNIYYSTYFNLNVDARNKEQALKIARETQVDENEVLLNLENWEQADEVFEVKD